MRRYCLYIALKQILINELGCDYSPITYNAWSGTAKDCMMLDIDGGNLYKGRVLATGEYLRKAEKVYMYWRIEATKAKILKAGSFGNKLDEKMVTMFNKSITIDRTTTRVGYDADNNLIYAPISEEDTKDPLYEDPLVANAIVSILRVDPQSNSLYRGRTPQGLAWYSDSFTVEYAVYKEE